ncbi:MAG TPA: hypothetical protein VIS05_09335 [Ilumatobacter sp.]
MHTPSTPCPPSTLAHASLLRQRAGHLRDLALSIERALVMVLDDATGPGDAAAWTDARGRLCRRMLEHNLHQLHQAADDLRATALRLRRRADDLELANRPRVA